ncbi:MAG: hypothetical protein LBT40_09890, partial [Deltaproteobacteria bacterium]|nr:hypothetical protein [Deltaproteobacteria bacterium]
MPDLQSRLEDPASPVLKRGEKPGAGSSAPGGPGSPVVPRGVKPGLGSSAPGGPGYPGVGAGERSPAPAFQSRANPANQERTSSRRSGRPRHR